jgi:hypothetical protein
MAARRIEPTHHFHKKTGKAIVTSTAAATLFTSARTQPDASTAGQRRLAQAQGRHRPSGAGAEEESAASLLPGDGIAVARPALAEIPFSFFRGGGMALEWPDSAAPARRKLNLHRHFCSGRRHRSA